MAIPGECVSDTRTACIECGTELNIGVLVSAAGYYIGFFCPQCGPYSRENGYFRSREAAEIALNRSLFDH